MDYDFNWLVLWDYRELLLKGLFITIKLSIISIVLSTIIGFIFGTMRTAKNKLLRMVSSVYVEFFLNTPLIIQLFFWYFALPMALPEFIRGWLWSHNYEFISGVIGLTIYTSTFIAEVIRAGIQSIDDGQWEAGQSSGLTRFQCLIFIIIPQAIQVIIPPLCNQYLNLIKNSSLAMTVAVAELTYQAQAIESLTFRGFEAFTAATLIYIVLTLLVSLLMNRFEKWINRSRISISA
ncbi:MAG: amino acid ABC transporter permease [Firmicutes bacterium]|nr:amino acid ABC transporter permease [Bacillota bacterium]